MTARTEAAAAQGGIVILGDVDRSAPVAALLSVRGHAVTALQPDEAAALEDALSSHAVVLVDVKAVGEQGLRDVLAHPKRGALSVIVWSAAADAGIALELGADDQLTTEGPAEETAARIELTLRRARRLLETSPLTGLPGNERIRRELTTKTASGAPLAVVHADVDFFKAYNDHYGFVRGDAVIEFCADCLRTAAASCGDDDVFLGHIGGDDFVALMHTDVVDDFCRAAIGRWDGGVGDFYDNVDRSRGWIESRDRQGNVRTHPPASLSLGVATNQRRSFTSPWQAASVAAEMKEYAKRQPGSNYQIDRRS